MIQAQLNNRQRTIVNAQDMKPGQIGIVQDSDSWATTLVLQTFDSLVSLDNPKDTWKNPAFRVVLLGAGESVTLTVLKDPDDD